MTLRDDYGEKVGGIISRKKKIIFDVHPFSPRNHVGRRKT
jgi:hypothetical protein